VVSECVLGSIQIEFQHEGHRCVMSLSDDSETMTRVSETTEIIDGIALPTWIEVTITGGADPDRRVRVELRDGAPQIVELALTSEPHQGEIRQKHYRDVDLATLATDAVIGMCWKAPPRPEDPSLTYQEQIGRWVDQMRVSKRAAAKFVERQRRPREYRVITDDSFLKSVAEVYKDNFDGAPRKAVAHHFGVTDRVASTYIGKARFKGFLSPTKQGQKKR
jgi:hypothetical protein